MDYEDFSKRINKMVSIPNDKQKETLIESDNSVHFVLTLRRSVSDAMRRDMERLLDAIYLIEERGAINGIDFMVCVYKRPEENYLMVALHTTFKFLSDEDFPKGIKRTGDRPW